MAIFNSYVKLPEGRQKQGSSVFEDLRRSKNLYLDGLDGLDVLMEIGFLESSRCPQNNFQGAHLGTGVERENPWFPVWNMINEWWVFHIYVYVCLQEGNGSSKYLQRAAKLT